MFTRLLCFVLFCVFLNEVESREAVAHLVSGNITGTVLFTETNAGLNVTGRITGLPAGRYGFHIHELGDTSTCDATGAHFNPEVTNHGGRDHQVRHVGDLGNVVFEGLQNAEANINFVDQHISLHGQNSILGRSLVLHAQEDDLGLGNHETSLTTGNAGARVACGVVGIKSPAGPWNSGVGLTPSIVLLGLAMIFVRI